MPRTKQKLPPALERIATDFEAHLRAQGAAANTALAYGAAARQLLSRTGRGPRECGAPELLAHKDWLAASYAPQTVNQRVAGVNALLDFAGVEGIRLKGVKVQQKPFLDNVVSMADYIRMRDGLLREGDEFWHFVVRFLAGTGARVSEARMFDAESVRTGYMDLVSKGDKLRRVYVPARLRTDALGWIERTARTGPLFAQAGSADPITTRGISLGLKRAAERFGVDPDTVYPHAFRHLFAKQFLARNPDITLLADLMGHDNIETTRIYLRRSADEQRAVVDATVDW